MSFFGSDSDEIFHLLQSLVKIASTVGQLKVNLQPIILDEKRLLL